MIICMLKENRLWDACTSCCSFPCSGGCPCVGRHMGPEQPWSSGRAGKVHVAHLPRHTTPPPSAEFTLPSTSWPVSVSIRALGSSRFGGELPVKMLLLDSSVGWGGSLHQWQPCLLPCLLLPGTARDTRSPPAGTRLPVPATCSVPRPRPREQRGLSPALARQSVHPVTSCSLSGPSGPSWCLRWVAQRRSASLLLNATCDS